MTREEVLKSISLKKRFCKDCNIPIAVFDEPYFSERLQIIDPICDCLKKFDIFCKDLKRFNSEQEYFEHYNSVKDSIISRIKDSQDFQSFVRGNEYTKLLLSVNSSIKTYPKKNLYIDENDGGTFISIDMKQANYSALNHFSSGIFLKTDSWENFVKLFTDCEHIINSKYVRQVILGACNPKAQIQYEHMLMSFLLQHIISKCPSVGEMVYSLGDDEILMTVGKSSGISRSALNEIVNSCPLGIGSMVRIEVFDLEKIKGTNGWMKVLYDFDGDKNRVEIKCLDAEIYHQVVKHYLNQKIEDDDLVFYHNGMLAKFLHEISNPWS